MITVPTTFDSCSNHIWFPFWFLSQPHLIRISTTSSSSSSHVWFLFSPHLIPISSLNYIILVPANIWFYLQPHLILVPTTCNSCSNYIWFPLNCIWFLFQQHMTPILVSFEWYECKMNKIVLEIKAFCCLKNSPFSSQCQANGAVFVDLNILAFCASGLEQVSWNDKNFGRWTLSALFQTCPVWEWTVIRGKWTCFCVTLHKTCLFSIMCNLNMD